MEDALAGQPLGNIGRYQLVDRLATGGMADVFLAVDPSRDDTDPIVLKRILPHLAQDDTFVRMFLQEARIAMSVRHRNVVRIDKLGEHEGLPYLAMEYIAGVTFRQLSRLAAEQGRPISMGIVVDLIAQACAGAHAVHGTILGQHREIVHRDLCPHNLMVDEDGVVKLLDFGIAKAAQGMDTTRTGALKGKISYLAPEQVRRAPVDRRTDLWTLSVVAWELLAGRRMFPDMSDYDVMQAIVQGDVPRLEEVRRDVPALIVEVIHTNLQVDPEARFSTAHDMQTALQEAALTAEISTHPATTRGFVRGVLGLEDVPLHTDASDALLTRAELVQPQIEVAKPRSRWWIGAAVIFGVLALALFAGGVALGALVLAPHAPEGPPVRVTFAPVMPPADMVAELEPLRQDLEDALDRPVVFQVAPTYEAASGLLVEGRTEFAVLPPYLYLRTRKAMAEDLELVAFTEHDQSDSVDGVLIAREDFDWQGPESLRGRRFCYTDIRSTTGYLLPRQWMRDHGIDPDADLGTPVMSGNHHRVIEDVVAGRCDVGATFSAALRSAFDVDVPVQQTRQLDITGHTPNDALCAGPGTDPELVTAMRSAALGWNPARDRGVRFVGERQHLTGFKSGDDAAYDVLRRTLEAPRKEPPTEAIDGG